MQPDNTRKLFDAVDEIQRWAYRIDRMAHKRDRSDLERLGSISRRIAEVVDVLCRDRKKATGDFEIGELAIAAVIVDLLALAESVSSRNPGKPDSEAWSIGDAVAATIQTDAANVKARR